MASGLLLLILSGAESLASNPTETISREGSGVARGSSRALARLQNEICHIVLERAHGFSAQRDLGVLDCTLGIHPGGDIDLGSEICSGREVGRGESLVSTISAHDQCLRYLWFTDDTEIERSRNSTNPSFRREEALQCDEVNGPEVRWHQLPIPLLRLFCGLLCEIMGKSLYLFV